jgi:TPP-dependent pyruvate/acetoin dehydrogenase alpha subunit
VVDGNDLFDLGHLQLAGYKVKCMLAEPKGKRGRADSGGGSLDNGPTWGQVSVHLAAAGQSMHALGAAFGSFSCNGRCSRLIAAHATNFIVLADRTEV